jgi:translation initiation factor 2 alpha subunit (eIF-2alpha)
VGFLLLLFQILPKVTLKRIKFFDKSHLVECWKSDSAPEKILRVVTTKSMNSFRKSSNEIANEIQKEFQILAKGHNVTYEIVNPLKHTRPATDVTGGHVSENGGT